MSDVKEYSYAEQDRLEAEVTRLRAALDESKLDHRRAVDAALAAKEAAERERDEKWAALGLQTCPRCDGEWLLNVEGEPCPFCAASALRERVADAARIVENATGSGVPPYMTPVFAELRRLLAAAPPHEET